ncbi:MAG: Mevalonate kinase [Candidatus Beckwithbacteria bacterium GW2011_GWB1_47_15]|uniref:Mevalonate kinase n=1 Tax=Candidatus Beckwithbacteria bacterium GW2011_GWB1_47_15 TaxID=1618371 RepID=A0A0G1RUA7_9BACT|nr:MAG: mevalonate kinase, mevalonate kinase [Candidatus Beckwithbacteria bacterium GW2011_GWC1_49_16]KKU34853.1 MAG: Mevalonate kinase [Candidatus Beckwithbacteria bacterium GW2011_GWA1_46_30]KKU60656.1 MAG: Mevalonate kinase [Candidatus Beckwithbacteria bacterium GW2011_GWB1_47_15]KKU72689.1 MAG: Mevalonate kinase [Candidatus Beckwithbacteria bacterium GW2011_GWA2_47_25]KKW02891.1 MAG: Mevalonate kinase [Candidatus Beckwithbacteria bacterium GW2011_GWC2_49_11]OGD48038.1 MAG: hypothetical pro
MKVFKATAVAPGKLLLLGDHAVVYNRPCLTAAVNRWVKVGVVGRKGKESVFVAGVRRLFERLYGSVAEGFAVEGFDSYLGLGSSAATTVAVAKAMFKLKKIKVSQRELFDFCYQVVRQVQELGSGFDVAASIYGGVIYFVTGGKKINRLKVDSLPLVVGYSGVKAETATMVKKAAAKVTERFLHSSEQIVKQGKREMEDKNWPKLGKLMNQNQKLLRQLGVSTVKLDKMIEASLRAGAYGAKLSGAGGGDCMIALHPDGIQGKRLVEKAIERVGGQVLKVKLAL